MSLNNLQSYFLYLLIVILAYILPGIDERLSIKTLRNKKIKRVGTFVLFVIMVVLLSFRNCGNDTQTYEYSFIKDRADANHDIVFFGLLHFVRQFTDNIIIWQFVIAFVTLSGIFLAAERLNDYVDKKMFFLYSAVYLYFFSFNYSRMLMSTGILVLSLSYLITEDYYKYICLNILAGLVHYSGFSALLLACIYYLGKNHRKLLMIIGVVLAVVIRLRPGLLAFLTFSEHYRAYFENDIRARGGIGTLLQVLPYFFILYFWGKDLNKRIITLMYALLIGNVAYGFLGYAIPVASRIARFSFAFPCIFIPAFVLHAKKEIHKTNHVIVSNMKSFRILSLIWVTVVYLLIMQPSFDIIGIIPYMTR